MPNLNILDDERLRLALKVVDDLGDAVGTTRWSPTLTPELDAQFPLNLFGQRAELGARAAAGVVIHAADYVAPVFGSGEVLAAPQGSSLVELHLRAGFGIAAKGRLVSTPLASVVASASTGGEIAYHHFIVVPRDHTRIRALRDVVRGGRPLPAAIPLGRLASGEAHVYSAWLRVDLGLQARYGAAVDLDAVVRLFAGFEAPLRAHVELSIEAGLGWSLYRDMRLVVAAGAGQAGWVRARIERSRRRKFSAGASVDLKVDYDLAQPLESILDYALQLDPTVELFETLEKVAAFAEQDAWDELKSRFEDELADRIAELVEDSGWREWTRTSAAASRLTELAAGIVAQYRGLDAAVADRVRALWADVLDFTDLQEGSKLRQALEALRDLDPDDLDLEALLGRQSGRVVELLETLTGRSFEELLIDDSLRRALTQARDAARRILELIDAVPAELLERFERLKERSGVGAVVAFLEEHASSKAALERAIDDQIRPLIRKLSERLIGKLWNTLDDDDIQKLQSWAAGVKRFLERKEAWNEAARTAIAKMRGEFGFSLSLELERVTESTAILDLEIDPRKANVRAALERGLATGDAAAILAALPERDIDDSDADEVDWLVREGLFTSRRVRSGSLTLLSTIAGKSRKESERVQESEVRIGRGRRTGRYAAGFTRRVEAATDSRKSEASVWWVANCTGAGVDPALPYDELNDELWLSVHRRDGKTLPEEIAGLDVLMTDLGFGGGEPRPIEAAIRRRMAEAAAADGESFPAGTPLPALETAATVTLRLPRKAVDSLLLVGEPAAWDADYLNAAWRWFREPTIVDALRHRPDVRRGTVLSALVASTSFREHWTRGYLQFTNRFRGSTWELPLDAGSVNVVPLERGGPGWRFTPEFAALGQLIVKRPRSYRRMDEAEAAHREAVERARPEELERAVKKIGRALRVAAVVREWSNPGFLPWLVLARASRDPQALAATTGAATLRWRRDPAEEFHTHAWRLEGGLPPLRRPGLFPFDS